MNLLQVGSHRGYDDFTKIVKKINPKEIELLLLVEPNDELNDELNNCYSEYSPIIENVVINNDDEKLETAFYVCDKNFYPDIHGRYYSELSSLTREHLIKHNINNSYIVEKKIKCCTINNLLDKYNITDLDVLFIDVEGFDYELIISIDFNKFNIKKIYYENLHIDDNLMIDFLKSKNYNIRKNILLNGWTNEAYK